MGAASLQAELSSVSVVDWNLRKPTVITYSSLTTFQRCEVAWWLRYVFELVPSRLSKPTLIGDLFHHGTEHLLSGQWSDPLSPDSSPDELVIRYADKLEQHADATMAEHGAVSADACEMVEVGIATAAAMLVSWQTVAVPALLRGGRRVVESEKKMDATISHAGFSFHWHGKMDNVLCTDQKVWTVCERKSRASLGNLDIDSLAMDQQANLYIELMRQNGRPTPAFVYDVTQKPAHRMSAAGRGDLAARMLKAMMEQPDKYHSVIEVPVDEISHRRVIGQATEWRLRMQRSALGGAAPPLSNLSSCSRCDYRQVCLSGFDLNDPSSLLRAPLHLFTRRPANNELRGDEDDV